MTTEERAMYELAPEETVEMWRKAGLLNRKIQQIDPDSCYLPPRILNITGDKKTSRVVMDLFIHEDEYGKVYWNDLTTDYSLRTIKKHMKTLIDQKWITICEIDKESFTVDYYNLLEKKGLLK